MEREVRVTGKKVCIIGLGYVGLPLACLCARKGYDVTGIDVNSEIVSKVSEGISPIKDEFLEREVRELKGVLNVTTKVIAENSRELRAAGIIIICVPTPIDNKFHPNLEYVKSAAELISGNLQQGQLIILESTVHPGTTEETLLPILEKSGLKAGERTEERTEEEFYLAHCPERIDPGNKKWTLSNIPRVLGACSKEGGIKAKEFYSSIIDGEITVLKSPKEAEATKIMENTFRDINIAFMNELAKSFDKAGIDIMEVIKGASTKPFAFLPHYPGCGVGGHCIPIDPYYLIERAKKFKFEHRFLELARKINESMPEYTVSLLSDELNKIGKSIYGSKIGLYGLAYKKNVDDVRASPAFEIVRLLKEKGAELITYDPLVKGNIKSNASNDEVNNVNNLEEFLEMVDYIIISTDHAEFTEIDLSKLSEKGIKVIIDGRNCLDKEKLKDLGIIYKGVGC